eukprot:TRINITY_DN6009_c0_g2_i1.p1 TRINITY_DN6009_c0_g2~~TRINITY_DN6009_c0_g2_i1.p1  ORF type:complete len:455 (+),score=53.46 TRINITY_DN6009_c0_g2_i1:282-1646(+)
MSRQHGCHPPFHPQQVSAWICILIFAIIYYMFLAPSLPRGLSHASYVLFSILFVSSVIGGVGVSLIDPADPNVFVDKSRAHRIVELTPGTHVISSQFFCSICNVHVNKTSKHCRLCDKCVSGFDHHCKWLNTCVAERNYRYFFVFIASVFGSGLLHLLTSLYLFIHYFTSPHTPFWYLQAGPLYIIVLGIVIFIDIPGLGFVGHLLGFHIRLRIKGLTTYEYIISLRKKKEQELMEQEQKRKKQVSSLVVAEKKTLEAENVNKSEQKIENLENWGVSVDLSENSLRKEPELVGYTENDIIGSISNRSTDNYYTAETSGVSSVDNEPHTSIAIFSTSPSLQSTHSGFDLPANQTPPIHTQTNTLSVSPRILSAKHTSKGVSIEDGDGGEKVIMWSVEPTQPQTPTKQEEETTDSPLNFIPSPNILSRNSSSKSLQSPKGLMPLSKLPPIESKDVP